MDPWLYVATAFSAITLLLTVLLAWRMPGPALSREELGKLSSRLGSIRNALDFAPAEEAQRYSGGSSGWEAQVQFGSHKLPRERRIDVEADSQMQLAKRVEAFSGRLERWCSQNGVQVSDILVDEKELKSWISVLKNPVKAAALQQMAGDFQVLSENAAKAALSRSDRNVDKEKSGPSQRDLQELVRLAGAVMIAPLPGDRVDPQRHHRSGTRTPKDPGFRGRVAGVATRGLERKDGTVIAQAEIYEYD